MTQKDDKVEVLVPVGLVSNHVSPDDPEGSTRLIADGGGLWTREGGGYLQVWTRALGWRRAWILLRCLGQMFEHNAALHRETSGDDTVPRLNVM